MKPQFRITADDQDITATLQGRLLALRLSDEAGMTSDTVDVQLDDRDGAIALPRTGAVLRVFLGYEETGLVDMGAYTVDEIEIDGPPATLSFRGRAADLRQGVKAPHTKDWDATTLGKIAQGIADTHGYTLKISPSLQEIPLAHVDQTDESDMHLITRLARQNGATAKIAGGALIITPTASLVAPSGAAMPSTTLTPRDVMSYRATFPERANYTDVEADYHDTEAAERKTVTSSSGDTGQTYKLRRTYPDQAQAEQAAKAKREAFERGLATISVTLPGRPELAAEGSVVLSGFRQGLNATWAIKKVEHTLDGQGYVSSIEGEVPGASEENDGG